VEDASHHFISGQHVVCVERVDDALLGLTVWTVAGNTAQHEETDVVRLDGSSSINHLIGIVVVVECLPRVVDLVTE
jgi:hypothetical protein